MKHLMLALGLCWSAIAGAELATEQLGKVNTLPVPYPDHWIFAHDAAFFHMSDGKVILLDVDAKQLPMQFKGMVNSAFIGQFTQAQSRPEFYVAETFYSRGNRGVRTDVVTVYDKATLTPIAEVVLPGAKKGSTSPEKYSLQLIDDEKYLLVFNLTPATSVTVVDIAKREIVSEAPIPGCALMYPSGKRSFSSLCGNGSLLLTELDKDGQVARQQRSKPFFNIDEDPLFEKPAIIDDVAYFPSWNGYVQPIDLDRKTPRIQKSWSLLTDEERAAGWRPGGWQLIATDLDDQFYLLMHSESYEGSQEDPGSELWVFDAKSKKRVNRIKLNTPAISVTLTQDKDPRIVVTTAEMNLDVYSAKTGNYLRTISDFGQETPFVVYSVNE